MLTIHCPKETCDGFVEVELDGSVEGNEMGYCSECDVAVLYHFKVEIDDIRMVEEE